MKIGFISLMDVLPWGGSEVLWAKAAEHALAQQNQVVISVHGWQELSAPLKRLQSLGAKIYPRVYKRAAKRAAVMEWAWKKLNIDEPTSQFQEFFNEKPDVICVNSAKSFDLMNHLDLIQTIDKTRIPYLVLSQYHSDHLMLPSAERQLLSVLYQTVPRVLFVSERNRESVERQLITKLTNAHVIQNAVALHAPVLLPWPKSKALQLACVARLECFDKGQDLLLQSLSGSLWKKRNWKLTFFGEGHDREFLTSLAKFYELEDRVSFAGRVPDVQRIWSTQHMLVLCSRNEGSPLSVMEAALCGRPSVVTDVGGSSDWVTEGETGFVAAGATANSFSKALSRAWKQKLSLGKMGEAAFKETSKKFKASAESTLLTHLKEVFGEKSRVRKAA